MPQPAPGLTPNA